MDYHANKKAEIKKAEGASLKVDQKNVEIKAGQEKIKALELDIQKQQDLHTLAKDYMNCAAIVGDPGYPQNQLALMKI